MKNLFGVGVVVVLGLLATCVYWYLNPRQAPEFLRGALPGLEIQTPQSPMGNFRPPQFGPR